MAENQELEQQETEIQDVTVSKEEYDKVIAELEDVKSKLPKDLSDEEKALQTKQQELFDKEVTLTLKENGLEQFASIVKVGDSDELKTVIESLTSIVNQIKIDNGYIPNDHKQQNEYDVFASKKDTQGMIATKLSKLFG